MDDFELDLKKSFLDEADQLLQELEASFLTLESNKNDKENLEKIFRIAHNFKGSSKAVGFDQLGEFSHHLENFLIKIKKGEIPLDEKAINLLLQSKDHLSIWVVNLRSDLDYKMDGTSLIEKIKNYATDPVGVSTPEVVKQIDWDSIEEPKDIENDQKISEENNFVDFEQKKSEEWNPRKDNKPRQDLKSDKNESIRVNLSRVESILNYVGELVINQTLLNEQIQKNNIERIRKVATELSKTTREIQELSMSLRMVPMKPVFLKLQRAVRDTSLSLSKEISLTMEGEETEVDKSVMEQIGDPLVHLVRNAVDHGIEGAEERASAGKKPSGSLTLRAYHENEKLVIEVEDDGKGIIPENVINKAYEKGIISNKNISHEDAVHLIFHPGFSTKSEVTEISGRGVGLDVVKTNVENMRGEVLIETEPGKGTKFKILIPLTLSIINGMAVGVGSQRYVIPMTNVQEYVKPNPEDLKIVSGLGEILLLRGENLPVFRLNKILKIPTGKDLGEIAVVAKTNNKNTAIIVDHIIGQYEIVIKKLGYEIKDLVGFIGSAILGDGKPSLILDVNEIIKKGKENGH